MTFLFHELLYRPLVNLLMFFYDVIPGSDIGIALILMTLVVRLIMLPLYRKSIKSQREIAMIQPKIKELQETYKDDKTKLSEEMLKVYSEHKINPFAGILLLIVQLPILIAVYRVSFNIFNSDTYPEPYPFVSFPEQVNEISLGFLNIANSASSLVTDSQWQVAIPAIVLALLVGMTQFFQVRLIMGRTKQATEASKPAKKEGEPDMAEMMNKQMMYVLPTLVTVFAFTLPTAMSLYWITTTVATIVQEFLLIRRTK